MYSFTNVKMMIFANTVTYFTYLKIAYASFAIDQLFPYVKLIFPFQCVKYKQALTVRFLNLNRRIKLSIIETFPDGWKYADPMISSQI